MDRKSLSRQARKLEGLDREQADLMAEALQPEPLIMGSLSEVLRTCGKPNCHCARKPAHRHTQLMTRREGRARCQIVRQADVVEVRRKVGRYKGFRAALRRLAAIAQERRELLKAVLEARSEDYH